MSISMKRIMGTVISFVFLISLPLGCGDSGGSKLSLQDIPRYPDATEGETITQSAAGGTVSGKLLQFTSTDPFDKVLDFYTDAMNQYDLKVSSQESEFGRQTALTVLQKGGMITIAIQEFVDEGKVNITFMTVES